MKLSFSLAPKSKPVGAAPVRKAPAAFGAFDNDAADTPDAAPTASAATARGDTNRQLAAQNAAAGTSKADRRRMAQEMLVDRTVYQYDEVYDRMKDAEAKAKALKEDAARDRKPKYIAGLLNTAQTRRLDHLRAEEKLMQRERESEGDEFADKEAFVTQAYKDQMAEVRRAEEEERQRDALLKKQHGTGSTGMVHFYKTLLEKSEQQHAATVAATVTVDQTKRGPIGPAPNLTIAKPAGPASDVERARAAQAAGVDVELNDDNQIVDKRELLTAGLNLSLPNTRNVGLTLSARAAAVDAPATVHRAAGTSASRREIEERRLREVAVQLADEDERVRAARAREEQEERERVIKRRNDEDAVQSARERFLARKRRKLEEGVPDDEE